MIGPLCWYWWSDGGVVGEDGVTRIHHYTCTLPLGHAGEHGKGI